MIAPAEAWHAHLGADAIVAGDAVYRYTAAGVVPPTVLQPATVEAVCGVVRAARAARRALIPTGNGTHLRIGRPPRRQVPL